MTNEGVEPEASEGVQEQVPAVPPQAYGGALEPDILAELRGNDGDDG